MDGQLSLSLVEIIVLMLGAIVLGITIHFFITSRRSLKEEVEKAPGGKLNRELDDWKRRYFNDIEDKDRELESLKKKFADTEENSEINMIEADEMRKANKELKKEIELLKQAPKTTNANESIEIDQLRKQNKQLKEEIELLKKTPQTTTTGKPDYMEQLRIAQSGLLEHNTKINQLLEQIDIVKETEEKQQDILKNNEVLAEQVDELNSRLSQKEKELNNVRQKEHLTTEMNSMLDNAYTEFNTLQEKMLKLEMQVINAKKINIEYEDLKEGYSKVSTDLSDEKKKYQAAHNENNQLRDTLTETENKLKEANFQRQQLQKKVAYLEELNIDMQAIADANKKLEGQIRRIGELESMLNVVSEERDDLARKQHKV
ncbi:MAG: hypothetical protein IPN82_15530 [Chitinophagaceae bacterium]|nr:hypothetical protein [Chitinophagaceae bacterium]MBK8608147.1 hypothetical protein [Chitinophagaceae bacterium]HQV55040.1 hypothetical protein [Chitinophagaceae bacterium]HQX95383.1 hypothetical protein [Chitinophagaceae bacterium]HRA11622.1 hypothetical protein [Chitinophagaceae bacterium]